MLLLALLLAASPAPGSKGLSAAPKGGQGGKAALLLRMGRFVQAEEVLTSVQEPSSQQRFQLTQALLGMGRCAEGEAMLPSLTPKQRSTALSQKLAICYAHHHQSHRAAEWLLEVEAQSAALQPGQSALLWLTLSRSGDTALADAVAQRAADRAPAHSQMQTMVAMRALDLGDVDGVDHALRELPPAAAKRASVHLIQGQLELDLGNLAAAEAHARAAIEAGAKDDPRVIALLAESRRRMGWTAGARMALKRKPLLVPHHPRLRNVAIRVAADEGDLQAAETLLARGLAVGSADPELYASAWYLHRQDKDGPTWARRWAQLNTSALRSLDHLVVP